MPKKNTYTVLFVHYQLCKSKKLLQEFYDMVDYESDGFSITSAKQQIVKLLRSIDCINVYTFPPAMCDLSNNKEQLDVLNKLIRFVKEYPRVCDVADLWSLCSLSDSFYSVIKHQERGRNVRIHLVK